MTYTGASTAAQSRKMLGNVLETLQKDPNIPPDVMSVAANIAHAVGALFEAERASSDVDGKVSVRHAMGSLSQTMALLQDVRGKHEGIDVATRTLADVMGRLYPLAQAPTHRPSRPEQPAARGPSMPGQAALPREAVSAAVPAAPPPRASAGSAAARAPAISAPQPGPYAGPRQKLEANVGATTESNFFVGFSGDISEGGVFVATYATLDVGDHVQVLVTLPGGFEKTIPGTVRFVRDPMDMESEPGIGVRFDRLDDAARELILRFIRKRPPLFYDE
jgi:uncharacterized protein (TIGR02266 family)